MNEGQQIANGFQEGSLLDLFQSVKDQAKAKKQQDAESRSLETSLRL